MTAGIYCYENKINGYKYIGQSQNLELRMFQRHKGSVYLLRALEYYGIENFKIYILEECLVEKLGEREMFWIKELLSHVSEKGYNISWGGSAPMRNRKHTLKTRARLSETHKGNKHPLFGKSPSKETREKIRIGNIGNVTSEETREKLRISSTGRKHREESKEKVRLSKLGIPRDENLKRKVSETKIKRGIKKKNSSSIYHNVCFSKRGNCIKWRSSIKIFGKGVVNIGSFSTEINAAIAYDKFVMKNNLLNILNFPKVLHNLNIFLLFKIYDITKRMVLK